MTLESLSFYLTNGRCVVITGDSLEEILRNVVNPSYQFVLLYEGSEVKQLLNKHHIVSVHIERK